MIFARIRFAIALIAFLAWLGWLATAVAQKGKSPVISRSQLTAATHLVVVDVVIGSDGLPAPTATVAEAIHGEPPIPVGAKIEVVNLPSAMPPGSKGAVVAGKYLLPVVSDGRTFRIAGLPRSPGYDATEPAIPVMYIWNDDARTQLHKLGLTP